MRPVALIATISALFIASPLAAQKTVPASPSLKQAVSALLAKELKDGMSAQYRWPDLVTESAVYCGFVNAKNSYGAYIGFKPFMVVGAEGKSGKYQVFSRVIWVSLTGDGVQQYAAKKCIESGYSITKIPD